MVPEFIEREIFKQSLLHPWVFQQIVRPQAYKRAGGDAEAVHALALETLNKYVDVVRDVAPRFQNDALKVRFCGKEIMPFGTAAGIDKNADALEPLSYLFGFQETGTIIVPKREGNKRPRMVADVAHGNLYNAQGFPSKGFDYALPKIREYREHGGQGVILANICGIPPESDQLEVARHDLNTLVQHLTPYIDGFVWNPFSPNTSALKLLRTPDEFKRSIDLIAQYAPTKVKLVKMGPYEGTAQERDPWMQLAHAWIDNGGDGLVAVNTKMVDKTEVPLANWGYPTAGRSGRALQPYRQRAISESRREFPNAVLIATGGIDSTHQAWEAFHDGATLLEGYSPYTKYGFGLLRTMNQGIENVLKYSNYNDLASLTLAMNTVAKIRGSSR